MTLLSVVRSVCSVIGVQAPASVFSGITGNRTAQELLDLANEMAQRIAYDTRDWTRLRTTATITGDAVLSLPAPDGDDAWHGGSTAFNLPANYKRMLLNSNVWRSTSQQQPMMFVPDMDEWLNRRERHRVDGFGEWTIMGGQIHLFPAMNGYAPAIPGVRTEYLPQTAYFAYMSKNCIALSSGGFGDSFLNDLDSFVLDERLLRLGMIWQWKAQKGSSYAEDQATYSDALAIAMGHDAPAPILMDRRPIRSGSWDAHILIG